MGLNTILKFLFVFNSVSITSAMLFRPLVIFHTTNYFFCIFIFFLLFYNRNDKMNNTETKLFAISVIAALSDILISFIFDTHQPNFLISSSILFYLIFNRLFLNDLEKQYFFLILTIFTFIVLFPSIASEAGKVRKLDSLYIVRNIPTYLYMIFFNISILNLSKLISNKKIFFKESKFINFLLFFYFLIGSCSLFLMIRFYFSSLGGIIMNLLSLLAIIFMIIHLIGQNRVLKISIFSFFTIFLIFFLNSSYFDEFVIILDRLWWFNNVAQGSILEGNYRTDYIGFLRCFLDYPFGTGFFGMQKLCLSQSFYELPDGIQPHNTLISFFLGYPLISLFILYYLLFSKKFRDSLISKFLINIPSKKGGLSINFILARYFHLASFLLTVTTSELHLKFPFF